MSLGKLVLSLAALLLAFPSLGQAQGTYTEFDVPGASSTGCYGVNSAGDIVGYYTTDGSHGFLLSGGTYTTIDYPVSSYTFLTGIWAKLLASLAMTRTLDSCTTLAQGCSQPSVIPMQQIRIRTRSTTQE